MPRIDIDEAVTVGLDGYGQLERKVTPGLPHRAIVRLRGISILGSAEPFEAGYLQPQTESSGGDKRSAKLIDSVSEPGYGKGASAFRSRFGCLSVGCSARQTGE